MTKTSKIRKLWYMGLEPMEERYSLQLTDWTKSALQKYIDNGELKELIIVPGKSLSGCESIVTGQVLDAHGRSYYSLSQMMWLVERLKLGEISNKDVIFFEDMFSPGIESLYYILDQTPSKFHPRIYLRCLAQTVDPDDFVHSTGMFDWMSLYERMSIRRATGILASNEEMVANMKVAGWEAPIYNISGLSFGKQEVLSRGTGFNWEDRCYDVIFAARFDDEKQPNFFMDLAEKVYKTDRSIRFLILTGGGKLKSNNQEYLSRVRTIPNIEIRTGLSKNEYYHTLASSKVVFNCALQDWTSNIVSEADTLGCNVLYPAYRSFPEIFNNDPERLYIPWSLDDAYNKLFPLLEKPHKNIGKISDWTDKTIDRMFSIMSGIDKDYTLNRNQAKYRQFVNNPKY